MVPEQTRAIFEETRGRRAEEQDAILRALEAEEASLRQEQGRLGAMLGAPVGATPQTLARLGAGFSEGRLGVLSAAAAEQARLGTVEPAMVGLAGSLREHSRGLAESAEAQRGTLLQQAEAQLRQQQLQAALEREMMRRQMAADEARRQFEAEMMQRQMAADESRRQFEREMMQLQLQAQRLGLGGASGMSGPAGVEQGLDLIGGAGGIQAMVDGGFSPEDIAQIYGPSAGILAQAMFNRAEQGRLGEVAEASFELAPHFLEQFSQGAMGVLGSEESPLFRDFPQPGAGRATLRNLFPGFTPSRPLPSAEADIGAAGRAFEGGIRDLRDTLNPGSAFMRQLLRHGPEIAGRTLLEIHRSLPPPRTTTERAARAELTSRAAALLAQAGVRTGPGTF